MANFLSWSYSRLQKYLACPWNAWCMSIAPKWDPNRVPYQANEHQAAGTAVDDALTARGQSGTPLPPQYRHLEPLAAVLAGAPGAKLYQLDLALDRSFRQCGSKDWDNCWVRVKIDYANVQGRWAYFIDHKNGKVNIDEKQLKLYSAVGFMVLPEVDVIDVSYNWLNYNDTTDRTYHRGELGALWQEFLPDVERMNVSFATNTWPATPENKVNGASVCKWCDVNRLRKCAVAKVPFGKNK